ncbi:hypothetical protein ACPWSR_10765 [Alloiococcus sp. CFN-8]|uniref:hypothetical protein n=1 Tax=Alloiococcus sp. CFN-8 TaxID=3416081 RepID=UPI003CED43D4
MFIDLNLRLEDTVRKKRECERLMAKLRDIEERISRSRDVLQTLDIQEVKDEDQIEHLRRLSISSLIYTLLFSEEGQLTRAEIEYIKIKCKMEEKKEELLLLEKESHGLKTHLAGFEGVYNDYEELMREKKAFTTKGKVHVNSEILRLSEELALSLCLIKETKELLMEIKHLTIPLESFVEAIESIDKLDSLKTERERLVPIKELRNSSLLLKISLGTMVRDLKDISHKGRGRINPDIFLELADFFTENSFVDFYEKGQISTTIEKSKSFKKELEKMQGALEKKLIKEDENLDDIKRSRISYIEAL